MVFRSATVKGDSPVRQVLFFRVDGEMNIAAWSNSTRRWAEAGNGRIVGQSSNRWAHLFLYFRTRRVRTVQPTYTIITNWGPRGTLTVPIHSDYLYQF